MPETVDFRKNAIVKVILATSVVTGLIHCFLWENSALCGESGVVFAFIVLSSFTAFKDGEIPLSFILVAVLFVGQEALSGVFVRDNISDPTHIIGGSLGGLTGYILNRRK